MELQPAVKKETLRIAVGTGIGVAIMLAVFALLGKFSVAVLLSGVIGGVLAVVNFLFLGITVQRVAAQDEVQGRKIMHVSYNIRMLLLLVWIIVAVAFSSVFNWVAAALPLLFPRLSIAVMQMTGYYKKDAPTPEEPAAAEEE